MSACPFCGKPVPSEWRYCGYCGGEIPADVPPTALADYRGHFHPPVRSASVTIAATFFFIFGVLWLFGAVSFFVAGEWLFGFGVPTALVAFLYIETGRHLWGSRRSGGVLGIVIAAVGIVLISTFAFFVLPLTIIGLLVLPLIAPLTLFCVVSNIALIALIARGWGSLR